MSKILDNLLSNAVNYSPEHGKIEIIYEENTLYIQNHGVTIEEELLPHVFEAFVTSNNSTKGHGLGLYIVSYYAKLLGCHVELVNIDNGVCAKLIIE
jgi:signal transduction histidine kinase